MTKLTIVSSAGVEKSVDAAEGLTLMEIIRKNDFDDLSAMCGGFCSCATCHIYIEDTYFDIFPVMSPMEDILLDETGVRKPTSRLSCQIHMTPAMEGVTVIIAPPGCSD